MIPALVANDEIILLLSTLRNTLYKSPPPMYSSTSIQSESNISLGVLIPSFIKWLRMLLPSFFIAIWPIIGGESGWPRAIDTNVYDNASKYSWKFLLFLLLFRTTFCPFLLDIFISLCQLTKYMV